MTVPHLTKTQILAAVGFAGDEAVAYGLLPHSTEQLVVGIAGVVLPGILMIADAVIHHAWAKVRVAEIEAEAEKVLSLIRHSDPHVAVSAAAVAAGQVLPGAGIASHTAATTTKTAK